jgi:hypothetical protein
MVTPKEVIKFIGSGSLIRGIRLALLGVIRGIGEMLLDLFEINPVASNAAMLPILGEEIGEVAEEFETLLLVRLVKSSGRVNRALTYDQDDSKLRAELIQVMAVTSAWVDRLDGKTLPDDPFRKV